MSFGENLRALLEKRNMTQKELAIRLNIAPSTMGNYVQNSREPDFSTLRQLAGFFNVSIDYLLDYSPSFSAAQQEDELLRIFRSLSPDQKDICVEQCRVFVRMNNKQKERRGKPSV